jgi:PP-loop superfamily ATP-utilizing enzyme
MSCTGCAKRRQAIMAMWRGVKQRVFSSGTSKSEKKKVAAVKCYFCNRDIEEGAKNVWAVRAGRSVLIGRAHSFCLRARVGQ